MSTSYYLHTPDGQVVHLGNFTHGAAFMFQGNLERGIVTYEAWRAQLDLGEIRTESGTTVTAEHLEDVIDDARRQWGRYQRSRPYPDQVDDATGNRFTLAEFC